MAVNVYNRFISNICRFIYSFILCRHTVKMTLDCVVLMLFSVNPLLFKREIFYATHVGIAQRRPRMKKPSEIRTVFGNNLRILSKDFASITGLAHDLGINRTQFNRYLSGESFPRPDILAIICDFFKVDARILLEPLSDDDNGAADQLDPFLSEFFMNGGGILSEQTFPSGFYRFSRRSFIDPDLFVIGLVYVSRSGGNTYLKGYETKKAMCIQHLPTQPEYREFRGLMMQQEEGIAFMASRKNTMTASFNYLSRVTSFHNNFWLGYTTRTVPEGAGALRTTRLVYEHIPQTTSAVFDAARNTGFYKVDQLEPFHRRLLRPEEPFT